MECKENREDQMQCSWVFLLNTYWVFVTEGSLPKTPKGSVGARGHSPTVYPHLMASSLLKILHLWTEKIISWNGGGVMQFKYTKASCKRKHRKAFTPPLLPVRVDLLAPGRTQGT